MAAGVDARRADARRSAGRSFGSWVDARWRMAAVVLVREV
jgi:hypothetical protein